LSYLETIEFIISTSKYIYIYRQTMSPLPKRQLGKSGPHVSAIGFGAMGLSASYGKVEENEARFAVLDRAVELGSTFWDTSDVCV